MKENETEVRIANTAIKVIGHAMLTAMNTRAGKCNSAHMPICFIGMLGVCTLNNVTSFGIRCFVRHTFGGGRGDHEDGAYEVP